MPIPMLQMQVFNSDLQQGADDLDQAKHRKTIMYIQNRIACIDVHICKSIDRSTYLFTVCNGYTTYRHWIKPQKSKLVFFETGVFFGIPQNLGAWLSKSQRFSSPIKFAHQRARGRQYSANPWPLLSPGNLTRSCSKLRAFNRPFAQGSLKCRSEPLLSVFLIPGFFC